MNLTKEEAAAIRALKRLSKTWPKTLWLFSASGTLCVMRMNKNGRRAENASSGGVDPDYVIDTIDIQNDGGDW